jgi:hypothetical protein
MRDPIAAEVLLVQRSGEAPFEVTLQIGRPYEDPQHPGEWLCSASLDPLYRRLGDARSDSALQSLCLALSTILDLLHAVVEQGGSVSHASGGPFQFGVYAFGAAAGERSGITL